MNELEFKKLLKERWFNGLEIGQEIVVDTIEGHKVGKLVNKDMYFKNVMVDLGDGQLIWFSIIRVFPVKDGMNEELYKKLMECK